MCSFNSCPETGATGADNEHIVLVFLELGHLEKPHVVPDTHRKKPNVHIGEGNPE